MNVITICHIDDLHEMINFPICINGVMQDEIEENMWCISIEENCLSHFTTSKFLNFFEIFMAKKTNQMRLLNIALQATYYIWFDQQALQLRCNILSGIVTDLPFRRKTQQVSSLSLIVDNFLKIIHSVSESSDNVEFIQPTDTHFNDEDDGHDCALEVYVTILNTNANSI